MKDQLLFVGTTFMIVGLCLMIMNRRQFPKQKIKQALGKALIALLFVWCLSVIICALIILVPLLLPPLVIYYKLKGKFPSNEWHKTERSIDSSKYLYIIKNRERGRDKC